MKTTLTLLLITLFAFSFNAIEHKELTSDKPGIVAITMHADWCGTCQALNPKLEKVKADLKDKRVLFTRFDFTDESTIKQSELMANWIGLGDLFKERKEEGKTGFVILINADTFEVLERITNNKDEDGIRNAIEAYL